MSVFAFIGHCTGLTGKDLVSEDQLSDIVGKVSDLSVTNQKKDEQCGREASLVVVNGSGVCQCIALLLYVNDARLAVKLVISCLTCVCSVYGQLALIGCTFLLFLAAFIG